MALPEPLKWSVIRHHFRNCQAPLVMGQESRAWQISITLHLPVFNWRSLVQTLFCCAITPRLQVSLIQVIYLDSRLRRNCPYSLVRRCIAPICRHRRFDLCMPTSRRGTATDTYHPLQRTTQHTWLTGQWLNFVASTTNFVLVLRDGWTRTQQPTRDYM